MKKTLLYILFFAMPLSAMALNKTQLQDTLTHIANRHAKTSAVQVKQVKVQNGRIDVYTNPTLSYLSISPALLDTFYNVTRELVGGNGKVRIYSDGHELSELITSIHQPRKGNKNRLPEVNPLIRNASRCYDAAKGLDGRHIVVYGSHGLYFYQSEQRWIWQRAKLFTTVEDLYTSSYVLPFLAPMLENAGAVVIMPRERDRQTEEVIVDNTEATGAGWVTVVDGGWGTPPDGLLYEGENPFTMGGYAYINCEKGKALRYTPALPKSDKYGVYISYKTVAESTDEARYAVVHKGIRTEFTVNQKMGGNTWVYVGSFDFGDKAEENYVEVLSQGKSGKVVTSDAVRFGGGMGSVARYAQKELYENVPSAKENGSQNAKKNKQGPTVYPKREEVQDFSYTSGAPRWIEGARYWMQYSGIPDSVYNYTEGKNDYTDDYASRGRWINYLAGGSAAYPEGPGLGIPVELGLAFHTDACVTTMPDIGGTLVIYTEYDDEKKYDLPNGSTRMIHRDYADYMMTQIVGDLRQTYAPEWTRRRVHNSSYAESRNPKVPTVLLELLAHDHFEDMRYGLDPSFRFVVCRAIYKAMLRFVHEQYGTRYVVQPLPVQDFAIAMEAGHNITLSWNARVDSLEATAEPNGYVLYQRTNGGDWDNGRFVKDNHTTITLTPDRQYDFKVCAVNDGGQSFPSEILSAYKASNEQGKVLIINGFTRVSAPDNFSTRDTTMAGFFPNHYGVGYGHEISYIGEQYEFDRSMKWVNDDYCGFGSSYNDNRNISPVGNTFDYPALHGRTLAKMGYSYVSMSVSALEEIGDDWTLVDVILGKQKETLVGTAKVTRKYECFPANLKTALEHYHGNLLLAGCYIGEEMKSKNDQAWTKKYLHYTFVGDNASHTGEIHVLNPRMNAQLVTTINEDIIPCERPNCLKASGDKARTFARYADSGTTAGIAYEGANKQLIFGFALESLTDFDGFYQMVIDYLR